MPPKDQIDINWHEIPSRGEAPGNAVFKEKVDAMADTQGDEIEELSLPLSQGCFAELAQRGAIAPFAQAMVETFLGGDIFLLPAETSKLEGSLASSREDRECFAFVLVALLSALKRGHPCLPLTHLADRQLDLEPYRVGPFPGFDALQEVVGSFSQVASLSAKVEALARDDASQPFVLADGYLYLERFHWAEGNIAQFFCARMHEKKSRALTSTQGRALERFFPGVPDSDRQRQAAESALLHKTMIISGGPGTGKTTTVARVLALLAEQFLEQNGHLPRLLLVAPTGKAAARLNESLQHAVETLPTTDEVKRAIEQPASTLHSALGRGRVRGQFRYRREQPLPVDLILVDEASMIDLALMSSLVEATPEQAQLILLGDRHQLASVDAGSVFFDLCIGLRSGPVVELTKSYRFEESSGIGRLASFVNSSDLNSLERYLTSEGLLESADARFFDLSQVSRARENLQKNILAGVLPALKASSPESSLKLFQRFRLLAAHRKGKWGVESLNQWVKELLVEGGHVPREAEFYRGQLIMVTQNDALTGLRNGDIGVIWPRSLERQASESEKTGSRDGFYAYFESRGPSKVSSFSLGQLPNFETAFASTVHKSQGSEFLHVVYVGGEQDSPLLTKELLYTAITRAKRELSLFATLGTLLQSASRCVARDSRLESRLQQSMTSAIR